jgi:hypothetical protein
MPKYVIHIGPPKTASSYLQSQLYLSREALLADGIVYPDNWWTIPGEYTHDPIVRLLRQGRQAEIKATFSQINATGCRIVVLSCEDFDDLTPPQYGELRDAIGNNPIDIVFYCRRWCERIPSAWKQAVRTGLFPTFPEYYLASIRHAQLSGAINSSLIWANIARIFGRSSLKLVSYNNLRDKKVDLFSHFTKQFLDWKGKPELRKEPLLVNPSPTTIDTEIVRALNWLDFQTVKRRRTNMHIKFTLMRPAIDTRVIEEAMADDMATIELSDGAEAFRLSWMEMQEYADCLVPRTHFRTRLFELGTASMPYVRSNYLLQDRAARELRSLYKRLDEAPCDAPGLM